MPEAASAAGGLADRVRLLLRQASAGPDPAVFPCALSALPSPPQRADRIAAEDYVAFSGR